jgi:hypothetical protein
MSPTPLRAAREDLFDRARTEAIHAPAASSRTQRAQGISKPPSPPRWYPKCDKRGLSHRCTVLAARDLCHGRRVVPRLILADSTPKLRAFPALCQWHEDGPSQHCLLATRQTTMMIHMEMQRTISACADTSVFGGAFEDEFREPSEALIDAVRARRFTLVTSELVRRERAAAPQAVRILFNDLLPLADIAAVTTETIQLQQAYLKAGVISERFATDALHVVGDAIPNSGE